MSVHPRWIHSVVQPVQEWLREPHYDRRTIDHVHRGDSGGGLVVVVEHAAQSFASLDNAGTADSGGVWENQSVAQTLMVTLAVVMGHEVLNSCPQRAFSKQDQPFQTRPIGSSRGRYTVPFDVANPVCEYQNSNQ